MTPAEALKMQMAELESALEQDNPGMKTILKDIHSKLKNDPEIVTLMSDEDISVIIHALSRTTDTEIQTAKVKSTTRKSSSKAISIGTDL